jgi:hypothetical protein
VISSALRRPPGLRLLQLLCVRRRSHFTGRGRLLLAVQGPSGGARLAGCVVSRLSLLNVRPGVLPVALGWNSREMARMKGREGTDLTDPRGRQLLYIASTHARAHTCLYECGTRSRSLSRTVSDRQHDEEAGCSSNSENALPQIIKTFVASLRLIGR